MNKNTMPELFDEQPDGMEQPTQEQILMSESELLRGLIEAGNEKDSERPMSASRSSAAAS